jgi:hypothetical protein
MGRCSSSQAPTPELVSIVVLKKFCQHVLLKLYTGYDTAKALLTMGATVVMACRSPERALAAKDQLMTETKVAETKIIFIKLDLCGFDSVRKFIKVRRWYS